MPEIAIETKQAVEKMESIAMKANSLETSARIRDKNGDEFQLVVTINYSQLWCYAFAGTKDPNKFHSGFSKREQLDRDFQKNYSEIVAEIRTKRSQEQFPSYPTRNPFANLEADTPIGITFGQEGLEIKFFNGAKQTFKNETEAVDFIDEQVRQLKSKPRPSQSDTEKLQRFQRALREVKDPGFGRANKTRGIILLADGVAGLAAYGFANERGTK